MKKRRKKIRALWTVLLSVYGLRNKNEQKRDFLRYSDKGEEMYFRTCRVPVGCVNIQTDKQLLRVGP